jgi:hypothetical protein
MSDVGWDRAPWWLNWTMLALIFVSAFWRYLVLLVVLCGLGWGAWVFGHQPPVSVPAVREGR